MDRINKVNHIVSVLRNKVDSSASPEGKKISSKNTRVKEPKASVQTKNIETLKSVIKKKLLAIDEGENGYEEKIEQVYISSTLSNEFGDNIINDTDFSDMVEDIRKQINTKPEIKNKLHSVIKTLLSS